MNWTELSERALGAPGISRAEALAVLESSDEDLPALLHAAMRVRSRYHGRRVNLHILQNAKSGLCSENCRFCSQSVFATSGVERYPLKPVEEIVEGARQARAIGAVKYCVVTSTRAPSERELQTICEAARRIKQEVRIRLCASLGLLTGEQAIRLARAGVDRYNHNLETSRRYFPMICTSHTFDDRVRTVRAAKDAGMEACCGGIVGMGETPQDRVDLAFELRGLEVEAIPVNFFDPRPGTEFGSLTPLRPTDALRALAMMRLVNPSRDVRAAGGREAILRQLQPLALYAANSLFTNGYLTTPGQGWARDVKMIEDMGFEVADLEA